MSNLVRVSSECLLEFKQTHSIKISDNELYGYVLNTKNIQFLNKDGSINDRDKSYCPYWQNTLLNRTPYPFIPDDFHNESALSKYVSNMATAIEYQTVSVNFASGWFYTSQMFATGIRFYYIIDNDYIVTVAALVDERTRSRIAANERTIVLDNTVFTMSYDVDIVNMDSLLNSNNTDIQNIVNKLFGAGSHTCSELFIEQFIIENEQIMDFVYNNQPHKRFFVNELHKGYWVKPNTDADLYVSVNGDANNNCILLQLRHTTYDTEKYLTDMLTATDSWNIEYEITTYAYNFAGNVIGSIPIKISNFYDPYTELIYRPIVLESWMQPESDMVDDKVDHLLIDIRCIATASLSNLSITRYATYIAKNPIQYYFNTTNINLSTYKAYSKKDVHVHDVKMNTDLPNIIQLTKPIYVHSSQTNTITLTPYDTNVSIDLNEINTSYTNNISIRIDGSIYACEELSNNKAIFVIPSSEYMKNVSTYYIFDNDNNSMITYGNITKI